MLALGRIVELIHGLQRQREREGSGLGRGLSLGLAERFPLAIERRDLVARLNHRVQMTTDGHKAFIAKGRHSPAECMGINAASSVIVNIHRVVKKQNMERSPVTISYHRGHPIIAKG